MKQIQFQDDIKQWLKEDGVFDNFYYHKTLPQTPVWLVLKIKQDATLLCGLEFFKMVFESLGFNWDDKSFLDHEGQFFQSKTDIKFKSRVPFNIAVTAERISLNLLQRASSIATYAYQMNSLAKEFGITILDTRKSTPGLRTLEKYAVRMGGCSNHRFSQTDVFMIKDNHKKCMGGLKGSLDFFKQMNTPYQNIVVEIHDMNELKLAQSLGVKFFMLDNFTPSEVKEALLIKKQGDWFELSGGIDLKNLSQYLIKGVDAISSGALFNPPKVDISLKFEL